jgi:DNA-binding CsgD family transcriptional regulator
LRLQNRLGGKGADLMAGALETVRAAAFVCDGLGMVRSLTPAAEAAVRRGPLRLKAGKLSATRPADARALEDAIGMATGGILKPHAPARSSLVIRHPDAPDLFEIVEVAPLPTKAFGLGFEARAVVTVRGLHDDDAELSRLLQIVFPLTTAEAAVVALLASGETREGIAADRQVSLGTVQTQIKRAFAKMNVRREAELFALIARMH